MKKITKRILPLLLGAVVAIPSISAFAATKDGSYSIVKSTKIANSIIGEMENSIISSLSNYKSNLGKNLSEEEKKEFQAIISELRSGAITREEANARFKKLGVDFSKTYSKIGENTIIDGNVKSAFFKSDSKGANTIISAKDSLLNSSLNLNEKDTEDMKNLIESYRSGKFDASELSSRIKALGIELPNIFSGKKILNPLSENQVAEVKNIKAQIKNGSISKIVAAEKFEELGINYEKVKRAPLNLTEDQKKAIKAINADLKAGKITKEEASLKFKALKLEFYNSSKITQKTEKITSEQKTEISKLREQLKNGDITKSEYYSAAKSILAE